MLFRSEGGAASRCVVFAGGSKAAALGFHEPTFRWICPFGGGKWARYLRRPQAVSLDYLGGNIYHFFGGKIGYFGGSFKKRER